MDYVENDLGDMDKHGFQVASKSEGLETKRDAQCNCGRLPKGILLGTHYVDIYIYRYVCVIYDCIKFENLC